MQWQHISSAPKDGSPILGWCCHAADPGFAEGDSGSLTLYAAHAEGLSHVEDGAHVIVWGGAWADSWEDGGGSLPDWWFQFGSDFEIAANPTHWMMIPSAPEVL